VLSFISSTELIGFSAGVSSSKRASRATHLATWRLVDLPVIRILLYWETGKSSYEFGVRFTWPRLPQENDSRDRRTAIFTSQQPPNPSIQVIQDHQIILFSKEAIPDIIISSHSFEAWGWVGRIGDRHVRKPDLFISHKLVPAFTFIIVSVSPWRLSQLTGMKNAYVDATVFLKPGTLAYSVGTWRE